MSRPITYEAQVRALRQLAEELTGESLWPALPDADDVIIEGEVEPDPEAPKPAAGMVTPARDPFAEWSIRRGQIALAAFDKHAWADLQEGLVESLSSRVATLERDVPEFAVAVAEYQRATLRERPVKIDADIAARYNVGRMVEGYFDDTVRSTAVPADDTAEAQGLIDAGEPIPPRDYRVTRPLEVPAGGKVVGAARFEHAPAARPELTVDQQFWGPVEKTPRQRLRHFGRKGGRRR